MKIEKARTGFCFGVRRAINILEKAARERGGIETLGAVVHNEQVLERLARIGVRVARDLDNVKGRVIATSSHGIGPDLEEAIRVRGIEVISTTCPFVRRAQVAARRLAESGFLVIIYGDADHPEVSGILGWTRGRGIAATSADSLKNLKGPALRRTGILSQTTQIPGLFTQFAKDVVGLALAKDSEIRIIDTICHDIRERQAAALELSRRVDLMLVIGGHSSANTKRLAELCSEAATTHLIQTADEVDPEWLRGRVTVGITAGASTARETVDEVVARLESIQLPHGE